MRSKGLQPLRGPAFAAPTEAKWRALLVLQLANLCPAGDVKRVTLYGYTRWLTKLCGGADPVCSPLRTAIGNRGDSLACKVNSSNTMIMGVGDIERVAAYGSLSS